jgi:hypothetical protein
VAGLYGLPVPAVVVGNKLDAAVRLSSGGGHFFNTLGRSVRRLFRAFSLKVLSVFPEYSLNVP